MSTLVVTLIKIAFGAVIGFFAARANGEGTKLDTLADKVDAKWDAKIKPELKKLETKIEELKSKIK